MSLGCHADAACAILDSEKDRKTRPIDIGVEESDPEPLARQRQSQIHRDGALAYAALAGADCDYMSHGGEADLPGPWVAVGMRGQDAPLGPLNDYVDVVRAERSQALVDRGLELYQLIRPGYLYRQVDLNSLSVDVDASDCRIRQMFRVETLAQDFAKSYEHGVDRQSLIVRIRVESRLDRIHA
jgi:hypothetical protein